MRLRHGGPFPALDDDLLVFEGGDVLGGLSRGLLELLDLWGDRLDHLFADHHLFVVDAWG